MKKKRNITNKDYFDFGDFKRGDPKEVIIVKCGDSLTAIHFITSLYASMEFFGEYIGYSTWVCNTGEICFSTQRVYPNGPDKGNYQIYNWEDFDFLEGKTIV